MNRLSIRPVSILLAIAILLSGYPSVVTGGVQTGFIKLSPWIKRAAIVGENLILLFNDGLVASYNLPSLDTRRDLFKIDSNAKVVGMGAIGETTFAMVFRNGTVIAADAVSGVLLWRRRLTMQEKIERAVISGRWIAVSVNYLYEGNQLDKVIVFDAKVGRNVFEINRSSDVRLVYVFDLKISGDLLLIIGIDTACKICELTDTYVLVYNLSSFRRILAERPGACIADISNEAILLASLGDKKVLYRDFVRGQSFSFIIDGDVIDVRVWNDTGYLLVKQKSKIALMKVRRRSSTSISEYDDARLIFNIGGYVGVAGKRWIYLGDQRIEVNGEASALGPYAVLEYSKGAIVLYGRSIIYSLTTTEDVAHLVIITEPGAKVTILELGFSTFSNESGKAALRVPAGIYTVHVEKEGYRAINFTVIVKPGESLRIEAKLSPVQAESPPPQPNCTPKLAIMTVAGEPVEGLARVTLMRQGSPTLQIEDIARNGSLSLKGVEPGRYRVEVYVKGFDKWEGELRIGIACDVSPSVIKLFPSDTRPVNRSEDSYPDSSASLPAANVSGIISALSSLVAIETTSKTEVGDFPEVVLDIDGKPVELKAGIKVIILFYTKCSGCKILLKKLQEDPLFKDVEIILIAPSTYDSIDTLEDFREEWNSAWRYVLDDDLSLTRAFGVTSFPVVAVVVDGKVTFLGVGVKEEGEHMVSEAASSFQFLKTLVKDPAFIAVIVGIILLAASITGERREFKEDRDEEDVWVVRRSPQYPN